MLVSTGIEPEVDVAFFFRLSLFAFKNLFLQFLRIKLAELHENSEA